MKNNDIIYPTMVIRSQAETIELLEQENKQLKERIDKAIEYIKENGEKQYNIHDNYRGKWYSPDDLDNLLEILKGE